MERAARFTEKFDALVKKIEKKGFTISEIEISPDAFALFGDWLYPSPFHLQRHWRGVQVVIAFHPPGIKARQFRRLRG